jgi:glycerol kinase
MTDDALILAIDQGTTNTKAILVDRGGGVVSRASRPMDIEYPQPGWVQQDADAIWQAVSACIDECLSSAGSSALAAIAISNQRETGLAWERASSRPIGPAVTWQCRRSAELCERLRAAGSGPAIQARTGLPVDPMFTAGKLRWLLDAAPDGQARAAAGELCVGTVDSWLLWNLTGGAQHRTDVSNASRTQLMDISAGAWDAELGELFGVPLPALPEILPSSTDFGETVAVGALPAGVRVRALIGDSHAALFGHAGFAEGSVKATYGTGSSLMMPTPLRLAAGGGLASTIAWGLDDGIVYALEGNIYVTGAAVQWLADFAGLAGPDAVAELAARTPSTDGIYLVPAFVGLGAPHWDDAARGLISGLTRGSSLAQLARATVESIAYQVRDVFEVMQAASGDSLTVLLADGGVTRNAQLMQFQADILGLPVQRNDTPELSAVGAAYLAGLASGTWATTDEIAALPRSVVRFEPQMDETEREGLYAGWLEAVARATMRARPEA